MKLFSSIASALWGDMTAQEGKKFGLLSLIFCFLIGSYWVIRNMKTPIFMKFIGSTYLPYASMLSVGFMIFFIMFYSKLVDLFEKHKLVYILTIGYSLIFLIVTFLLQHPTIGLPNTTPSKNRLFGWILYIIIETFGSFMPALFWSFVNSTVDQASAKKGYGFIIFGAQFGSILGCVIDMQATRIGMQLLFVIATLGIVITPLLVYYFVSHYPTAPVAADKPSQATGFLEGLRLLVSRPYLLGILGISTLFEVVGAIIDYQMHTLSNVAFPTAARVTEFEALFGLFTNGLTMTFAIVGTSFFLRIFGIRISLIAYPIAVACAVAIMWAFHGLWVIMFTMVVIKGLSYSLNNPCRDIMYIPTSKDIRFKVKGWIDTIGMRSAKSVGAATTTFFPVMSQLVVYGSLISFGVIGVWILAALYVGKAHQKLTQTQTIIE